MTYLAVEKLLVQIDGNNLLSQINFRLYPGELCALIGSSGAGKSTLIKSMLGLIDYQAGRIRLPNRHKPIAYVPQDDHLHSALRVDQELDYACQLRLPTLTGRERQLHIKKIIRQVGLGERIGLPIKKLSGGQRKRVSVALELLTKPDFMILDEPTSGLDPGLDAQLMQLFSGVAKQQKIVLVATHNMQNMMLCDNMLIMKQGHIVYFGPPTQALVWFEVQRFEDIFPQLQASSVEKWFHRYIQSSDAKKYAKRVPNLANSARDDDIEQNVEQTTLSRAERILQDIRNKKRT